MIFTEKKPIDELLSMIGDKKKVALVGCASCATSCKTGGEEEIAALKAELQEHGIEVVGSVIPDESCQKMLVKKDIKAFRDSDAECIISMACGNGAQTVAQNTDLPVYPANNTMYLAQVERIGIFNEMCRMCGNCEIGHTAGICPITKCAKSLVNGPCGGQKNGKCEVNPENDCAWILIYNKMKEQGREDEFITQLNPDKGYAKFTYPRSDNLKKKAEEVAE